MASHNYPPHPPTGGKGLPPPAHFAQPHLAASPSAASSQYSHIQGQPPDLEHRFKLKVRYLKIQKKYFRSLEIRKDLELELAEKEAKQQKLQDEVDLLLDQIHQSDYAHLRPKDDNIFSEDEGEVEENERIKREGGLEEEERERRKELEEELGVDSNQTTINPSMLASSSKPPQQQAQVQSIHPVTSTTATASEPVQPPNPKRIKLTFGSGASNIQVQ
ncbi:hypothetical protein JCM16303_006365 [Sporobolomyces ruberrimus]